MVGKIIGSTALAAMCIGASVPASAAGYFRVINPVAAVATVVGIAALSNALAGPPVYPGYYYGPPVAYAPAPVSPAYYAPAPGYYSAAPYYPAGPVVYAPGYAPTVYFGPSAYYYGGRHRR
jgi:hypothetical protein